MSTERSRFEYVDALRGIAALMVIYFHAGLEALRGGRVQYQWEASIFGFVTDQIDIGKIAVTLFFAVSGFVIPFSLRRSGLRPKESFVVGRLFRLYPAYWLSLLAAFCVEYVMLGKHLGAGTLLANITMLQGFVGQPSMQGLYWTLQIELIFYAICLGLFTCTDLRRTTVATAMAVIMIAAAIGLAWLRYMTGKQVPVAIPLALFVMFLGLLWRLATIEQNSHARSAVIYLTGIFLLLMPLVAVLAYDHEALRYILTYYISVSAFLLLTSRFKLGGAVLSFLGTISYSVYLLGSLVQKALDYYFSAVWGSIGIPLHLVIVGMMAVSIVLAWLSYRFVEAPAIRLGKAIIQRRLRTSPVAGDAIAL